jgi:hypothetical protein
MSGRFVIALLALVVLLPSVQLGQDGADAAPIGGKKHFYCVLSATLVVVGMVTFQPEAVLIGNLVGGLACPFGW